MRNVPEYCSQNDGDCWRCNLQNFGRDCMDNPLTDDEEQVEYDETDIEE